MTSPFRKRLSRDNIAAVLATRKSELQGVIDTYREGARTAATVEKQKDYRLFGILSEARLKEVEKLAKALGVES